MLPSVDCRQHKGLSNRAENSPADLQPREAERRFKSFKSIGQMQRALLAFGPMSNHVRLRRERPKATGYRQIMKERFEPWNEVSGLAGAA